MDRRILGLPLSLMSIDVLLFQNECKDRAIIIVSPQWRIAQDRVVVHPQRDVYLHTSAGVSSDEPCSLLRLHLLEDGDDVVNVARRVPFALPGRDQVLGRLLAREAALNIKRDEIVEDFFVEVGIAGHLERQVFTSNFLIFSICLRISKL